MGRKKAKHEARKLPSGTLLVMGVLVACFGLLAALFFYLHKSASLAAAKKTKPSLLDERDEVVYSKYAGSKSCRDCHTNAYALWENSHHRLAERHVNPEIDRRFFEPAQVIRHNSQTSEVRIVEGHFEVLAPDLDGQTKPFKVERVIGENPLRQYMTHTDRGRWQVTEIASDPVRGDWFNVFGDEDRKPGEWGHWTGRGMNWNSMCAACHNTRLRKNYRQSTDGYETRMAEMGVGCEACHGPMADHVAWQKKHGQSQLAKHQTPYQRRQTLDPTLDKLTKPQWIDTCGMCHSRRGELTGDFSPGDNFADHHSLVIVDETDIYYPDGQVREEDYEYGSFVGSRMYAAGVQCSDCHEPHSAKTRLTGNQLCMRCHGAPIPPAPKIDASTHSFHKPNTPGDLCVDCHMPVTTYMQRHPRRDHGFTIPDPLLTKQFGIPNACNRCHNAPTNTVGWALQWVEKWYGTKMERPYRHRAQVIARARQGDNAALPGLLKIAREEKIGYWRAVATGLLRRWAHEPQVAEVLLKQARDTDALVRSMAVRGLDLLQEASGNAVKQTLSALLSDTTRLVRVEAAWALRANLDTNTLAGRDLLRFMQHNSDQPAGLLQIGIFLNDRGKSSEALACFQKAVEWDGGSAPLRHALAVSLSQNGRSQEAVQQLEMACKIAPRDAEYRFKLGLAYNETGRLPEATASLEEAVKLDPQYAQAWYNLGLAYAAAGKLEAALNALGRAETLSPQSAHIPYATATILARLGRISEARTAAQRALSINPGFAEAMQLLLTLQ